MLLTWLYTKLNWTKLIHEVIEKVTNHFNLLKRITGMKWEACQSVLVSIFNTYIMPVFEYGALLKLDIGENKALRHITDSTNLILIATMQL